MDSIKDKFIGISYTTKKQNATGDTTEAISENIATGFIIKYRNGKYIVTNNFNVDNNCNSAIYLFINKYLCASIPVSDYEIPQSSQNIHKYLKIKTHINDWVKISKIMCLGLTSDNIGDNYYNLIMWDNFIIPLELNINSKNIKHNTKLVTLNIILHDNDIFIKFEPCNLASSSDHVSILILNDENDNTPQYKIIGIIFINMTKNYTIYINEIFQLIDLSRNIVCKNEKDNIRLLLEASEYGNINVIEELIKLKVNINLVDSDGDGGTALIVAAQNGQDEVINLLIENKVDINYAVVNKHDKDTNGVNALWVATQSGYIKAVDILIKAGSKINVHNDNGYTALIVASEYGYNEIVNLLIDANLDNYDMINSKTIDGETALTLASKNGHNKTVIKLLQAGANVNEINITGITALMMAVINNKIQIVKQLTQHKDIDLDEQNTDGCTALIFAIEENNNDMIDLLIDAKLDNIIKGS